MITFAIIAVLQSLWYFTITLSFAVKQIQATRVDLINVIKNGLNVNDIASLAQEGKINSTGFTDDPKYLVIMDWLDSIHKVSPTTWPYVFVPDKQGQDIINLVDLSAKYKPDQSKHFLQKIPFDTADDAQISTDTFWHFNDQALQEKMPDLPPKWETALKNNQFSQELMNQINMNLDSLGNWVSIYSYIRDDQGNIIAGVGVDIENSIVSSLGVEIFRQLIISFIGSLLIMMLVGMRLGTVFTKPIVRLTRAAEVINTGDHNEGLKKLEKAGNRGPFRNEIDQLVDTISKLVNFQHAIYTISATANTTSDQNELFNQTYQEIHDLFPADRFSIAMFSPESKMISLIKMDPGSCDNCQQDQKDYKLETPPDLIGYLVQSGQPLNLTRKSYKLMESSGVVKQPADFSAWLGVPLKWDEKESIGVLTVQSSVEKATFSENDKGLLEFIATQLSMILKRTKAEAELRQSYQLLEQRVTDRTADLQHVNSQLLKEIVERERAETEMLKAKESAEAANIAKSVFLANMSHELRTPLNAILGFSNLMTHDPNLPAHHKEDLTIIQQSGEHLLDLINDVLEMSKIEAGRNTLNPNSFDLHQLLSEVEEVFQSRVGEKGLSLIFDIEPNLPQFIHTDEKKLRQILFNLLSNAIKFTESGGVTLRGRFKENLPDNKVKLAFEVEDTGQGIQKDQIKDLFDYFVQTDTGKKSQEGTGLGLAISKNFIQLMSGSINVQSEVGKGSLFSFDFTAELSTGEDIQITPKKNKVVGLEPGQSTKRILVVEDREANRKLLVKLLQPFSEKNGESGFEVREAVNGKEAVNIWDEWTPDLIFMDMRMPEMNGHVATQIIREKVKGDSVIIIALTASAFEEDRKLILSEGINDFIRKPFKEHEIFDVLNKYLGVRFIYADEKIDEQSSNEPEGLNSAMITKELSSLPPDWLLEFKQAASAADGEQIIKLLHQIYPKHKQTTVALEGLVAQYRFDLILNLIP
jgi:signal transduction histidine kinase/DNA-binding NarL/FixJ family response regulator